MADGQANGPHTHQFKAPFALTERDTVTPGTRARAAWEVVAGVIPGQPMPEYTKRWIMTSEAWEADILTSRPIRELPEEEYKAWLAAGNKISSTFQKFSDEAAHYAKALQNPEFVNWVQVSWIWY